MAILDVVLAHLNNGGDLQLRGDQQRDADSVGRQTQNPAVHERHNVLQTATGYICNQIQYRFRAGNDYTKFQSANRTSLITNQSN